MCYLVYFSTTSDEDFSKDQSEFYRVDRPDFEADAEYLELLAYPNRWYLESRYGGCSCHFRHSSHERSFAPPEDWCPEDSDDVESTAHFYDLLHHVLAGGHLIDVLDVGQGATKEDVRVMDVELGKVPRDHFRFLEGYRITLRQ